MERETYKVEELQFNKINITPYYREWKITTWTAKNIHYTPPPRHFPRTGTTDLLLRITSIIHRKLFTEVTSLVRITVILLYR